LFLFRSRCVDLEIEKSEAIEGYENVVKEMRVKSDEALNEMRKERETSVQKVSPNQLHIQQFQGSANRNFIDINVIDFMRIRQKFLFANHESITTLRKKVEHP